MKRFFLVTLLVKNLNFLIHWLWRLLPLLCALALGVSLYSFHPNDPGWSHSATQIQVKNLLRLPGAKVADLLFSTLGRSAWLLPLLFIRQAIPLKNSSFPLWRTVGGGSLFLFMSAAFESIRLYSTRFPLPQAPGGVFGDFIGTLLMKSMGFNGATVVLLVLWAVAFSLAFGVSWSALAETIGWVPERLFNPERAGRSRATPVRDAEDDEDEPLPARPSVAPMTAPPRFNPQAPRAASAVAPPSPAASGGGRALPNRYRPQQPSAVAPVPVKSEETIIPSPVAVLTPVAAPPASASTPAATTVSASGESVSPPTAIIENEREKETPLAPTSITEDSALTDSNSPPIATVPAPQVVTTSPVSESSLSTANVSPYAVLADSPASHRAPVSAPSRRRSPAPIPLESVVFDEAGSPQLPVSSVSVTTAAPLPSSTPSEVTAAPVSAPALATNPSSPPVVTAAMAARLAETPIIGSRPHPIPLFDVIEQAPVPEPVRRSTTPDLFTVLSEPTTQTTPLAVAAPSPTVSSIPASPTVTSSTAIVDKEPLSAAVIPERINNPPPVSMQSNGASPPEQGSVKIDNPPPEPVLHKENVAPTPLLATPSPPKVKQNEEIPSIEPRTHETGSVNLEELIHSSAFNNIQSPLALTIGRSGEEVVVADLVRLPHLLLVSDDDARIRAALHGVLAGIFRKSTPREGHVLLLTPYSPMFQAYQGRDLLEAAAPAADLPTVSAAIQNALIELERRYNHFKQYGVRNLQNLNRELIKNNLTPYPLAAIVLDDLGQMLAHADREFAVQILKLAQYGPAGGMHFIAGIHPTALSGVDLRLQQALPARLLAIAYEAPQWQFQRTLTGASQRLVMVELDSPAVLS